MLSHNELTVYFPQKTPTTQVSILYTYTPSECVDCPPQIALIIYSYDRQTSSKSLTGYFRASYIVIVLAPTVNKT